jgi:hypothetical protein
MMLHVVLFTPRADATDAERQTFSQSLDHALTSIPSVRAFRVGRRVRTGAAYDDLPGDFEFCAVIEFDDRAALQSYQQHPVHAELGRLFYVTARNAFAGDFDAVDNAPAHALTRWHAESR